MLKKILIGTAVVAVLAAVVVFSMRSGGGKKGTRVYVEKTEVGDIVRVVKASGEIDPRIKVNISSPIIGKIEELWVEEGERPLPCRYTITSKWTYGAPQYTVTFTNWQVNPKLAAGDFQFTAYGARRPLTPSCVIRVGRPPTAGMV